MQQPDALQAVESNEPPPPLMSPGDEHEVTGDEPSHSVIDDPMRGAPPASEPESTPDAEPRSATPVIDEHVETKVRCPQCTTKASWRGPLTDEMLARTFTRGVNADSGLPNCPRCGHAFELVTFVPIEHAIAHAAEQIAGERRQPRIPGLLPEFNFEAAFTAIIDQRAVVRRAQATAEDKHKAYAKAKKTADEEQGALSTLEDEFTDRARDAAYDRTKPAITGGPCAWELQHGRPCPVCRQPANELRDLRHDDALPRATELAASDVYPCATDLRDLVAVFGNVHLTREQAQTIPADAILGVLTWLRSPNGNRPTALGRSHVIDARTDRCRECRALLGAAASDVGLPAFEPGMLVGTDCDGAPEPDVARAPRKRHASRHDAAQAKQRAGKAERQAAPSASSSGVQKVEKGRSRTVNPIAPKPRVSGMGKKHGRRGRR